MDLHVDGKPWHPDDILIPAQNFPCRLRGIPRPVKGLQDGPTRVRSTVFGRPMRHSDMANELTGRAKVDEVVDMGWR